MNKTYRMGKTKNVSVPIFISEEISTFVRKLDETTNPKEVLNLLTEIIDKLDNH